MLWTDMSVVVKNTFLDVELEPHLRSRAYSEPDLCRVPGEDPEGLVDEENFTTVTLQNIPSRYTRPMFLEMLDAAGFHRLYDFVYLPTDFKTLLNHGDAFVNMVSHETACRLMAQFRGFTAWSIPSRNVCDVCWSVFAQGFESHIERYKNSPVMHALVPDEFKPAIFNDGKPVPFPSPTKKLRPPRIRHISKLPEKAAAGGPASLGLAAEQRAGAALILTSQEPGS